MWVIIRDRKNVARRNPKKKDLVRLCGIVTRIVWSRVVVCYLLNVTFIIATLDMNTIC